MMLILMFIRVSMIFHFMMLKSKFSVKRNQLVKAFGYSRGSRRLSKEFLNHSINNSYSTARLGCYKTILLQIKAHIREILTPYACCALFINERG